MFYLDKFSHVLLKTLPSQRDTCMGHITQKHWQKRTTVPHEHLQRCNQRQQNTSCLETGKHHTDPQTKQRYQHWDVIQADIPSIRNRKDTREGDSSLHNTEHTKHHNTTRVQNQTLHKHSTTQQQKHCHNRFQPTHPTHTHHRSNIRHE